MAIDKLTDENFENEVLKSDKPYLAIFSATEWCNPCKMLHQSLPEFEQKIGDLIVKLAIMILITHPILQHVTRVDLFHQCFYLNLEKQWQLQQELKRQKIWPVGLSLI